MREGISFKCTVTNLTEAAERHLGVRNLIVETAEDASKLIMTLVKRFCGRGIDDEIDCSLENSNVIVRLSCSSGIVTEIFENEVQKLQALLGI